MPDVDLRASRTTEGARRRPMFTDADARRSQPYPERAHLRLPLLPTTTLGSFPQTGALRTARAELRAGRIGTAAYEERIRAEIRDVIAFQEQTAIDDLDADVISLEAARSPMQVARELAAHGYPREAGPGVYDIHAPRVPGVEEASALLRTGLEAIPAERLWVTPGCDLKTRALPETRASLENLVAAARTVRAELGASTGSPTGAPSGSGPASDAASG